MSAAMRKIQEDPLFLIKKEEAKHHKSLVENPLVRERVKQLLKAEKEREASKVKQEMGLESHTEYDRNLTMTPRTGGRYQDRHRDDPRDERPSPPRSSIYARRDGGRRRSRSRSPEYRHRSRSNDRSSHHHDRRDYDRRPARGGNERLSDRDYDRRRYNS